MTFMPTPVSIARIAGADLSASQNFFVKQDTSNEKEVVLAAANTDKVFGIVINEPESGDAADVVYSGGTYVKLGGTVAIDDFLGSDANGKAVTVSTTGNYYAARALKAGVLNDLIPVVMERGYIE